MNSDLIALNLEVKNKEEVIQELGKRMFEKGYVKSTYIDAVLEREKTLPTGLDIGEMCVAIPHTDSKHVNESNVALAVLKNPVEFRNMIDPSKRVEVMVVFLLAINDPDSQVTLLSKLMSVFQNVELLKQIKSSSSTEEVTKLLECIGI
ncbi:PTS sugar transporter subunit IIA [Clostridium beijerinckii]|jgi:Phosphotransferase system mannitol/fructose-specific IIA domain (Ntr-type)|uniref:PTS sugar transporter subunit IIA n=2 Tax=Clostridium beijerinckii TaxID=1520 RepID=A0AAE2RP97_CLOBE|nr:PTS sugar transporter subunit IIA [Clostridium beijerinckii]ABR32729.1 putative PTS IIA-like nitrogen-regulatory protein PtsN [Clostridium beijerinckii NCIMB 8052]AIU03095.1 putative PTS IIA-like nitrogen-regulatory protein PtsN [Clostridium beijerinckii ATCC 35702]MBF7807592.1 PTS sugar transporter subunit IIA [Clostridium beijerinckii]NRT26038.1 PTS system galactitol-specific IIA component [Clostridium beijerinckii]NRT66362.1 PTS system galactitol-specific IIA component [Clostridium beije